MATSEKESKKPLWLVIEEKILELDEKDLSAENTEAAIQRIAGELDNAGYNISHHGGNMLEVRWAMKEAHKVGRPLLKDINAAVAALTLADVADAYLTTDKLIHDIGATWSAIKRSERRAAVISMVEKARLDLLIAKAKDLPDDKGIRFLIGEKVAPEVIMSGLDITAERLEEVKAQIAKELAERERVAKLLEAVAGKSDEERVRHLLTNDVAENLILEMAQVEQRAIDGAKQAMEAELKEKQRQEAEAAARKKAEAEGPALEDIPSDKMLEYIESIREIMEFSDQEKEIRVMCEQSSIPKCLIDIAVTEPGRLDELEKKAEG